MPDRAWRRTPQEEFREQVRALRRLHNTAANGDEDAPKRIHARSQWFDEVQITLEQLAEQPTVWRGVNEAPSSPWQALVAILSTGNPIVWLVFGFLMFAWVTGWIKIPNPFSG